jgi:hypothetical protein
LLTWNGQRAHSARDRITEQTLQQAKEALIAHALVYDQMQRTLADPKGGGQTEDITLPPGTLPGPDTNLNMTAEGSQDDMCGKQEVSALARFPWRSLGTGPLRDANGECLWYAVSGSFKANPSPDLLNWDSPGAFEIRVDLGNVIESDVIAVIFAAGDALAGQSRAPQTGTVQCGGNYTPSAYLDADSVGGTDYTNAMANPAPNGKMVFIAGPVRGTKGEIVANDRLITITRDDLFARSIEKRADFATHLLDPAYLNGDDVSRYGLAQKLAGCLAKHGKNNADSTDLRLPWAAPLDVADFQNDSFDDKTGLYAGRPAYRVGSSRGSTKNALVPAGCSSTTDNCRLLIFDHCLAGWWRLAGKPLDSKGVSKTQIPEGWWDKWKDQYFYVVSPEFSPKSNNNGPNNPNPCTPTSQCITVGGKRYAAVIAFAGKARSGQQRITLADRQNAANYLDDSNTLAFSTPTAIQSQSLAVTGNDQLVCINPDLTIDSTCH